MGYGYNYHKKSDKAVKSFFNGVDAALRIANRAYKAQQRENRRRERAIQSFMARQEREEAAAMRCRIREAERKAREQAREQVRLAKESEKLQKQKQFEEEVNSIIEENKAWTSLHKGVSKLVSDNDLNQAISDAEFEKSEVMSNGLFEEPLPDKKIHAQSATNEANSKYNTSSIENNLKCKTSELCQMHFDVTEPTEDCISAELTTEAKNTIKAFWPWKKKRLIREFVDENLQPRFKDRYDVWAKAKSSYESNVVCIKGEIEQLEKELNDLNKKKKDYIDLRTEELYSTDFSSWKAKRDKFYEDYIENLHGLLNGEQSYVESALVDTLSDNDLPMEYFVDSMYDESTGLVRLDVDLPEIEDLPQQKIVLASTGKQCIRSKGVKDLNDDYAQCICGLAIFLAEDMFNVSPKIKNVEVSGFTQRPDSKTSLVSDQYVFVINFNRDVFDKINFEKFTAIQIFSFFQHHINATKTMVLKEIDLTTAYDKLQHYQPVNYDDFILQNPEYAKHSVRRSQNPSSTENNPTKSSSASSSSSSPQLSSLSLCARATVLCDKFYNYVSSLDSYEIRKHAQDLSGVNIKLTQPMTGPDCDVTKYRGKLFFVCAADLFNSLKELGIDPMSAKEPLYIFALFVAKVYVQKQGDYSTMPKILSLAYSFNSTFASGIANITAVPHKYLILELMSDYHDLSYYRDYMDLLKNFAQYVEDSCENDNITKNAVRKYLSQLREYEL